MDLQLAGKVAIVTGGSRGLGYAAAQALVGEGANLLICARGEGALKDAANGLQSMAASGARVASVAADVSTESGASTVIDAAVKQFGRI